MKFLRPALIITHCVFLKMLGTVNFYGNSRFRAIEIQYIGKHRLLTIKARAIVSQEVIPQVLFLRRHILS